MASPRCTFAVLLSALLVACGGGGTASPANGDDTLIAPAAVAGARDGLAGRLIVGYQGWYGCPGDFEGNSEWIHWFVGPPLAANLAVDMLPATQALDPADLCDTGLVGRDGQPLRLFSSQNANVVDHHFMLMAQQGIGAVALQRFVVEMDGGARSRRLDNLARHVQRAALRHGVPFFVSYDVSGADAGSVVQKVRQDWTALQAKLALTTGGAYLHDGGRPVLQLWGFGFRDRPGEPQEVAQLIDDLQRGAAGLPAATVVGGVPTHWRTLDGDARPDPAWAAVYRRYDVISPWSVGRYRDAAGAESFFRGLAAQDAATAAQAGIRYLPVIFPGFSWFNLMRQRGQADAAHINAIPRACGRFLLHQATLAAALQPQRMVYGAMFDEFDEGTALLPAMPSADGFPPGTLGVALDQDGCALPAHWYLELAGNIAFALRTGSTPVMP